MILRVFPNVGDCLSITDAYHHLIALYEKDPNRKNKAAGSLGGAVNGGTIIRKKGFYERIR